MVDGTSGEPHGLQIWLTGDGCVGMEAESEAGVLAGVTKALEVFEPDAPPPSRIHRTQWWSDRHTRGAYSYVRAGATDTVVSTPNLVNDQNALSLHNRILSAD